MNSLIETEEDTGGIDLNASPAKRVKRRVTSRTQSFFAAAAPGLEELCRSELLSIGFPEPETAAVPGGVVFSGKLQDCYSANLHLRTANRILMRLSEFRATGFAELEKKLSHLDWELYLPPKGTLRISVTSAKSRLYHKDAVAERIRKSVLSRMGSDFETSASSPVHLFARVESDTVMISLDSSGELLHKRGVKPQVGKAPLRETLATAVLKAAGYRPGETLLDPMCGSGSFSFEAAMICRNIPAGWFRTFAFMEWPAFSFGRWQHIRREAEKSFITVETPCVFASDVEDRPVSLLREHLSACDLLTSVQVSCRNFFDLDPEQIPAIPGLVVFNPPYGRRIGSIRESRTLISEIVEKLEKDFKGWRVALLTPADTPMKHPRMFTNRYPLLHGGLHLMLLTGTV